MDCYILASTLEGGGFSIIEESYYSLCLGLFGTLKPSGYLCISSSNNKWQLSLWFRVYVYNTMLHMSRKFLLARVRKIITRSLNIKQPLKLILDNSAVSLNRRWWYRIKPLSCLQTSGGKRIILVISNSIKTRQLVSKRPAGEDAICVSLHKHRDPHILLTAFLVC